MARSSDLCLGFRSSQARQRAERKHAQKREQHLGRLGVKKASMSTVSPGDPSKVRRVAKTGKLNADF